VSKGHCGGVSLLSRPVSRGQMDTVGKEGWPVGSSGPSGVSLHKLFIYNMLLH